MTDTKQNNNYGKHFCKNRNRWSGLSAIQKVTADTQSKKAECEIVPVIKHWSDTKSRFWHFAKSCHMLFFGVESMSKTVKRGYVPNDEKEFYGESVQKLYEAAKDLQYLLDRGYRHKRCFGFIAIIICFRNGRDWLW